MKIRTRSNGTLDVAYPVRCLLTVDIVEQPEVSVNRWKLRTRVLLQMTYAMFLSILAASRREHPSIYQGVTEEHGFAAEGWKRVYQHQRIIEDSWEELMQVSARAMYVRDKVVEDLRPELVKAGVELQEYVRAATKNRINLIWSRGNE